MSAPIRFECLTSGGEILRAHGVTRNVSSGGICFELEHPLAVGVEVEFNLQFPGEQSSSDGILTFRCQGRVLRIERLRSGYEIHVSIQSRKLLSGKQENHREHMRVTPRSPIVADCPGLHALVRDLSQSGAFLDGPYHLRPGQEIEPHLYSDEMRGEIVPKAVIRRVEPHLGMAVDFVALSAGDDRRLRKLLQRTAGSRQGHTNGSSNTMHS